MNERTFISGKPEVVVSGWARDWIWFAMVPRVHAHFANVLWPSVEIYLQVTQNCFIIGPGIWQFITQYTVF